MEESEYLHARDQLVEGFELWAKVSGRVVAPMAAHLALDYKWCDGDRQLARWTVPNVEDLLTLWLPAKVVLEPATVALVGPTLTAFLDYLEFRGLLGGDGPEALRRAVAEHAAALPGALDDPVRFGGAKAHLLRVAADRPGTVALGPDRTGGLGTPPVRCPATGLAEQAAPLQPHYRRPAPVRLAPAGDLAEQAAATPLLRRLRHLLGWVGGGRRLSYFGNLPVAERAALARELLAMPGAFAVPTEPAAAVRDLSAVLALARSAALVATGRGRVAPTVDGVGLVGAPLELWWRVLDTFLEVGPIASTRHELGGSLWGPPLDGCCVSMAAALYARREPVPVAELAAFAVDVVGDQLTVEVDERLLPDCRRGIEWDTARLLARLEDLGATERRGDAVALTPLGCWGMNRWLRRHGGYAPVVGELADADAATLLDRCTSYDAEALHEELSGWVARRGEHAAAEELLAAAGAAHPATRSVALRMFELLGEPGVQAVWALLEEPRLRPFATVWLLEGGHLRPRRLSAEDTAMYVVESCAALLEAEPDQAVRMFAGGGDSPEESVALLEQLWQVPSPYTQRLLDVLAERHPDTLVAGAAREAAERRRRLG